jgi:hypothetical protein
LFSTISTTQPPSSVYIRSTDSSESCGDMFWFVPVEQQHSMGGRPYLSEVRVAALLNWSEGICPANKKRLGFEDVGDNHSVSLGSGAFRRPWCLVGNAHDCGSRSRQGQLSSCLSLGCGDRPVCVADFGPKQRSGVAKGRSSAGGQHGPQRLCVCLERARRPAKIQVIPG